MQLGPQLRRARCDLLRIAPYGGCKQPPTRPVNLRGECEHGRISDWLVSARRHWRGVGPRRGDFAVCHHSAARLRRIRESGPGSRQRYSSWSRHVDERHHGRRLRDHRQRGTVLRFDRPPNQPAQPHGHQRLRGVHAHGQPLELDVLDHSHRRSELPLKRRDQRLRLLRVRQECGRNEGRAHHGGGSGRRHRRRRGLHDRQSPGRLLRRCCRLCDRDEHHGFVHVLRRGLDSEHASDRDQSSRLRSVPSQPRHLHLTLRAAHRDEPAESREPGGGLQAIRQQQALPLPDRHVQLVRRRSDLERRGPSADSDLPGDDLLLTATGHHTDSVRRQRPVQRRMSVHHQRHLDQLRR